MFGGKLLDDNATLADCKVVKDSTVQMLPARLEGALKEVMDAADEPVLAGEPLQGEAGGPSEVRVVDASKYVAPRCGC